MDNNKPQQTWKDRNRIRKIYKISGKFGWMHLVIAENKITQQQFLRLKRYLNWFSIPDISYFYAVQEMLKKGAKELGWPLEKMETEVQVQTLDPTQAQSEIAASELDKVPDEIIDFIKDYPHFTKDLISLNIKSQDHKFVFDLLKIIDKAINDSGDRIKTAFKEVIEKVSTQDAHSMQELSDLMDEWNLYQITSLVNILKTRLETIETFEQMIQDEKTYEINTDKSIHRVLEKSMWLIDENYWIVQSNKTLRTFIGEEIAKTNPRYQNKRPDFACVNRENKLIIIEIKRPSIELKKQEIDQAELYMRFVKKFKGQKYASIEVYLIGNKISDEAREISEFRRGIHIKTYTDLLEEARTRYQEYLKIVEE